MSINQSMNIALGSMKNNQYALSVVSHNIANLNTDGYHRQRVDFSESRYTTSCSTAYDTIRGMCGSEISSLSGFIDNGVFNDLIDKNADAKYYDTLSGVLGDLEGITDELGENGLGALLNEFYTAASNLEKYPTDVSIRQQFLLAAENVCDRFNYASDKLGKLEIQNYENVQSNLSTINSLAENLAEANLTHVTNNQSDATKSTIDNILSELSNYVNVSTKTNPNGSVNLYIGGVEVVQGTEVKNTLECSFDESQNPPLSIYLKSTDGSGTVSANISDQISAGSLRAYNDVLNGSASKITSFSDIQGVIDKAAAAFGNALNDIQTYSNGTEYAAYITADADGNKILAKPSTTNLITTKDGSSTINALNIQVNPAMDNDPFLVAAARIDTSQYSGDEWKKAIGNSSNAAEFSALRNAKIVDYDNGIKVTLSDYLVSNASKVGMDASNTADKADLYQDLADSAAANYSNLIGVNLDEELADMIKYQRSFEASARVFAAANSIMETILNMV